jgi:capsular polysaccharide biosynthesis protein
MLPEPKQDYPQDALPNRKVQCARVATARQGLYPETMNLDEQVRYMQGAKLVICGAGASIANAMSCRSNRAFIILTHRNARSNLMSCTEALGLRIGFVYRHPVDAPGIDVARMTVEITNDRIERAIAFFKSEWSSGEPDGWH